MDFNNYFAGKRITVMRIGLLGRGVGDAAFLAAAGAEVLVVDDAPQSVMQPSVNALAEYPNITFKFGPYDTADFISADYVLVGAGTPIDSPELAAAKLAGVPLKQSAAWFAELSGIPIVGVTGTRGKSTVTHMIHHVLSQVTGENILLGGNIRGRSNLQLLNEVQPESLCVMELDSWQLQGWNWAQMSPQIAVFTNFMEDHLNYYQGPGMSKQAAMDFYFADKSNIFRYQEESGVLITTPEVFDQAKQMPEATLGQEVVLVDASGIPADGLLAMPGEHNRLNAALATAALRALSLTDEEIFPQLASFPGVEGRLQYIGAPDGVGIFNDNNATTPIATVRALEAVGNTDSSNVILIAGGADKNIDPTELIATIPTYCKHVMLLPGTGTDRLIQSLKDTSIPYTEVDSVAVAVEAGLAVAQSGDMLLFSPGYASFGLFKNEYERNDAFLSAVNPLI